MKTIDEEVLLGLIEAWENTSNYYEPNKKHDKMPVEELKAIIREAPAAGEDAIYIRSKRILSAYNEGKKEILNQLQILINKETKESEREMWTQHQS